MKLLNPKLLRASRTEIPSCISWSLQITLWMNNCHFNLNFNIFTDLTSKNIMLVALLNQPMDYMHGNVCWSCRMLPSIPLQIQCKRTENKKTKGSNNFTKKSYNSQDKMQTHLPSNMSKTISPNRSINSW